MDVPEAKWRQEMLGAGAPLFVVELLVAYFAGVTRTWAQELAGDDVRVNAVSPGPIDTLALSKAGVPREQMVPQLVPLKRLGTPNEVACVVAFLCSPGTSFVTGAQCTVGGGMEA